MIYVTWPNVWNPFVECGCQQTKIVFFYRIDMKIYKKLSFSRVLGPPARPPGTANYWGNKIADDLCKQN